MAVIGYKRWAATDGVPVGDRLPTGDWPPGQVLPADASLSVPLGTPPGDYSLQAALYDPLTNKSLPVSSGADGTRARLGVIQVARAPEAVLAQSLPAGLMLTQPIFDNRLSLEQAQFTPSQIRPGQAIHAERSAERNIAYFYIAYLGKLMRGDLGFSHSLNQPVRQLLAERLQTEATGPLQQIERAYLLMFGRPPSAGEAEAVVAYAQKHGLAQACRLLFNANEFLFVD